MDHRTEHDSMGPLAVPARALYGAQTQRAVDNFPISGQRFPRGFLRALGLVKLACAQANADLEAVDAERAKVIIEASREVMSGALDEQFVVDIYQTGSGTSTNMNANEVIANRATVLLGGELGSYHVHPNDHVNRGQSSNDVIPTSAHIAAATALSEDLLPALAELAANLEGRSREFASVLKSGRTHLMDATPMTLGQEFSGYAAQLRKAVARAGQARDSLMELALGGTAIGTGLNRPLAMPGAAIDVIRRETGLPFIEAHNHFEAQAARDDMVEAHGHLNTIATSLTKVANDIRWLGSGPRAGLYELSLPATQPGSSIMPGKVNPVMSEMLTQVAARVAGNQTTMTVSGMGGAFELNTYIPVMSLALLESIQLLANGARVFSRRCITGLRANQDICERSVERNLSIGTALAPVIGYDLAAAIAKEAFESGRTIREVALERGDLSEGELARHLDAQAMTRPDPD